MKIKQLKQAQRTISMLLSMIDSGEQHSLQSRSAALESLMNLEALIKEQDV